MPTQTIPNRNFDVTPQQFGPFSIGARTKNTASINVQLTSADWAANPGRRLHVFLEQSDDGTNWRTWSDDNFLTGQFSAKSGALPSFTIYVDDGNGSSKARRARVTVDAPDGVVNAGAVITF